ncbi:hypothetical protein [Bacteroides fragilis]|uniref:hypothetical protein n=1 Tax=Bacteroides fragilis TaxID=817 RepID=UPI00202DFE43|nr:hypothetical protein [Bacteroides fragilis]
MDAASKGITFKQSDEKLRISETILGTKVTPEQKKILENHGMVSIENMRNPKTKLFSDDVRFSNKSKTCSSARTPASTNRSSPGGKEKKAQQKTAHHVAPFKAKTNKSKLSIG